MGNLLAIDPGSVRCGLAFFEDSQLTASATLTTKETDPIKRRFSILHALSAIISDFDQIACEAPILQGANNNGMQRFLGVIEFLTRGNVTMLHPMTVKKFMGSGKMEKKEMAEAACYLVKKNEALLIQTAIQKEAFDETDAVCVGLCAIGKQREAMEERDR